MSKLVGLHEAMVRLDAAWAGADDATELSREQLVAVNAAIGVMQRCLEGVHADVAAGISRESRAELGSAGLAKEHGFRNPAKLIAATTGVSTGDATRLVAVGEATAPRTDLLGTGLPARYPVLRDALASGAVGVAAAGLIIALLERCRVAAGGERIAVAERSLAGSAAGLSVDDLRKVTARAEAWLDPDGIEPRDGERRGRRSLTMFQRDGMLHLNATLDPETAAPVVAAIRGFVRAAFGARQDGVDPDAADADRRTLPMIQADALAAICDHLLGCRQRDVPLAGGSDGHRSPRPGRPAHGFRIGHDRRHRPADQCQRRPADGRQRRCHPLCPRWWQRDHGPTDLSNGVLLCETCHHRIHDNDWEIRIDGPGTAARVWFIPPGYVDPARTPRLGGRARFDIAA